MPTVPVITSNSELFTQIKGSVGAIAEMDLELIELNTRQDAQEYLNIEMPDLAFIDFSDAIIDPFHILQGIMSDLWLLHGGIIGVCSGYEMVEKVEAIRGANLIVVLTYRNCDQHLTRIMRIISTNRRIIFQREIGSNLVSNISGSFRLNNDPLEAHCYANLISNFLYNSNKLTNEQKNSLNLSLVEMLMNAIEHGNCGVSFKEKSRWLEQGNNIRDLIENKCQDPQVAARRVTFEYSLKPTSSRFFIADEGEGFDWQDVKDVTKDENWREQHSRGILVAKMFTENLTYNEKGNEVTFEIGYEQNLSSASPSIFIDMEQLEVKAEDIIFQQGEPSNFLYFIVKGAYNVIVNNNVVSTLSADDIFMGEMSFLLNNQRSATVQACTEGRLIKISKKEFVEAIRQRPHYALFLCKLLAQRVVRKNTPSADR